MNISAEARKNGIAPTTAYARISRGWDIKTACTTPARQYFMEWSMSKRMKTGFEDCPHPYLAPRIIASLRDGFGVQDICIKGVCNERQARRVIDWLRRDGRLERIYSAIRYEERRKAAHSAKSRENDTGQRA